MANAPLPKYEISRLETSGHTDGRVHFPGLLVTVPVVTRCISSPLARCCDLRQDPGVQRKLCADACWSEYFKVNICAVSIGFPWIWHAYAIKHRNALRIDFPTNYSSFHKHSLRKLEFMGHKLRRTGHGDVTLRSGIAVMLIE